MGPILALRGGNGEARRSLDRAWHGRAATRRSGAAALDVRRWCFAPCDGQRRGDPAGGEVRAPLAHLLQGGELGVPDLARLEHHRVEHAGIVRTTVEDEADGVVPAAPRWEPVGQEEVAGLDDESELLLDLSSCGIAR